MRSDIHSQSAGRHGKPPDGRVSSRGDRGPRSGKRAAFRAWRHSRPFLAGLLMILGAVELLALILSGLLVSGAIKMVIYIGIGGVFGILVAVLLLTAGIAVWINPAHRVFYSVAAVVLGLISFPATNLGGFFIGMLLAMLGGAFGFAWTRDEPEAVDAAAGPGEAVSGPRATFTPHADGEVAETIADGFPAIRDDGPGPGSGSGGAESPGSESSASDTSLDSILGPGSPARSSFSDPPETGGNPGQRLLAIAALPAVLAAGILGTNSVAKPASVSSASLASSASSPSGCFLWVFCPPSGGSSSPSASPSPSASSSSGGLLPSGLLPSGSATPSPSPSASSTSIPANTPKTSAPSGLVAPAATSKLTTGSAVLKNFNFVGLTSLPRDGGGTEQVMEFTADTASLTKSVHVAIDEHGSTSTSDAGSFEFTGGMTLYTTQMCGQVEGITPNVCFTPSTVSAIVLKLAGALGKAIPITMTNASISNPLVSSGQLALTPMQQGVTA